MKNKNYPLYKVEPVRDLKELVNYAAEKYFHKPAFIFERDKETVTISYRQFKLDVDALGTYFFSGEDIRNTKFALIGENSYEWILTYFSVVNSGNVIVPLDRELPKEEVKNLIVDSGAEVFVFSDTFSDIAEYLKNNDTPIRHYVNMNDLPELVEKGDYLVHYNDTRVVDYEIDNQALAALLYTSGTTGSAKGVMLSHQNLSSQAVAICKNIMWLDKSVVVLPLHHASGFLAFLCMSLYGTAITINQSMKNLHNDFLKYKPRITVFVPLLIETFYKQIKAMAGATNDLKNLKKCADQVFGDELSVIISGGAPLDKKLVEGYRAIGIEVLNAYGLTECSGIISTGRNCYNRAGSGGQIVPCAEVRISNPNENGHGEIWTKGNHVMLGYYKNKQATKEAFDGEWLKTGDIGYMDDDGFLYISGRKKNMILLSNGKNVYPEELEFALLNSIPYIKETVVYAEDNLIVAEVFLDTTNNPDCAARLNADIISFNQTQAPYKNIGKTVIRETEFPKTTTRKIKRQYK